MSFLGILNDPYVVDIYSPGLNPQFTGVFRKVAATASIPIGNGKPNVNVKRGDVVFSSFRNAQMDVRP